MPLVLILSAPFLVLLARRPVLRRLAFRNASRRPRETALVLLGSLLGTAIITGSLVVGDTLTASFRRAAYTHQGPIDELVVTSGSTSPALDAAMARFTSPDIDGTLRMTTADASVLAGRGGPALKAEPHGQVIEVDFDAARRFGNDPGVTGISGATPAPGHAAITKDLARTLGVGDGDTIHVSTFGHDVPLVVDRVLPRKGVAGFRVTLASSAPNVFVAPGTIAPLAASAPPGAPPPSSIVAVSNKGGVIDGSRLSDKVAAQITAALGTTSARVQTLKKDTLKAAKEGGKQFSQLFAGIGFFSVLAGVLLLVNIFVMLAQERKTEMGMLRAVGMRRSALVASFSLEGWLYALASSVLGMVAGLGVGKLIVIVAAGIFSHPGEIFSLDLRYAANVSSVLAGFAIGFTISLVTVVATSLSIARLNVIRAIRDLPEPPHSPRRRLGFVILGAALVAVGLPLFGAGVAGNAGAAALIGPAMVAGGAVLLLRRWVPIRTLVSVATAAVILYSISGFELFPKVFADAQIPVFVVLGVILTGSAVGLVSQNQDTIGHALRRVSGGSRSMAMRLGLAYPLARRFRTGMILAMYSLVVFTLVFMTTFSHLFSQQVDAFTRHLSGGFDVQMSTNASNPVDVAKVKELPSVSAVSVVTTVFAQIQPTCAKCEKTFSDWPISTFDDTFLRQGPPTLSDRLPEYRTNEAAFRALANDPNGFIPGRFLLQRGAGPPKGRVKPGDTVVLKDPESGRTRSLHVLATLESGPDNPLALISPAAMAELFAGRAAPNLLYVAVKPGASADGLAATLNGQFVANGADAKSFRAIVSENLSQQKQFFRLIQGYLALGLLVGIAGLGVVMVRAVRERRRQVGVLRALGFEARAVRRAFVAESAFVAFEGIVIGTALALVTAWRLVGSQAFGAALTFSVPVLQLTVLVVGTFVASLIATVTPAQQASRIKPAVALRIAD